VGGGMGKHGLEFNARDWNNQEKVKRFGFRNPKRIN
jgi:hypothetical protein